MKLKKLAQNTILVTSKNSKTILIDPGKYNIGSNLFNINNFPIADILIITHKHADHYDLDIVKSIISRSNPVILTNSEINGFLIKENIESKILNIGDTVNILDYSITGIRTDHVVRDENILNFGVVVSSDGASFYHTSDTRYIEPSLLPKIVHNKCVLVPISNRGVVMGIDDALVFCNELNPSIVIPMHYDSPKDLGRVNPEEFMTKGQAIGLNVQILKFGQEIVL